MVAWTPTTTATLTKRYLFGPPRLVPLLLDFTPGLIRGISFMRIRIVWPWDASVLLYGFQAYFRQDATQVFGESSAQYWDVHVEIGGTDESLYTVLPRTRADASVAYDSGLAHEEYWPYVTKQHMKTSMAQGYHPITISIWSRIDATSFTNRKEKLLTPTGAVWALAIR